MDFQSVELTVEDILAMHRLWITKLYVEDKKTEADIVQELYERQLIVRYARSPSLTDSESNLPPA